MRRRIISWEPLAVAVDSKDPSIIYVGDRRGRIAKSIDRGKTWDPLIDGTVRTLSYPTRGSIETLCNSPDCEVRNIVVDPRSPSRIFLTKIGKAFFSEDGGLQWSEVGPASSALFVKEILPWGDRLLLSATESCWERHRRAQGSRTDDIGGGLYLSEDSGASWVRALNKGTWDICVSTLNNNVGYAAGGYIFRSDDGGRTWIEKGHPPLGESSISAVEMNPKEPDIVYAATCGWPSSKSQGVFRSTDGGDSWVAQGLQGLCIRTLAVDPLHPNILYAGGREVRVEHIEVLIRVRAGHQFTKGERRWHYPLSQAIREWSMKGPI